MILFCRARLLAKRFIAEVGGRSTPALPPVAPSKDAIWLGEYVREPYSYTDQYLRTRQVAYEKILARLQQHLAKDRRVLVGFDFSYGYPSGFSSALNLPAGIPSWQGVWSTLSEAIEDAPDNSNNRFQVAANLNAAIAGGGPGPFWGCPAAKRGPNLDTHGPGFPFTVKEELILPRLRHCESRLPGVQEVWKLFYAGCVGSQVLMGIPRLAALRNHPELEAISAVWPFETGFVETPLDHGARTGTVFILGLEFREVDH